MIFVYVTAAAAFWFWSRVTAKRPVIMLDSAKREG